MSNGRKSPVVPNAWRVLQEFTDARIGLGRSGISLPTAELLAFQLAHARARDAVKTPLNIDALLADLNAAVQPHQIGAVVPLHSGARDRLTYLQRPDLGRTLSAPSRQTLQQLHGQTPAPDLAIAIVDGLSSSAVQQHAAPLLAHLLGLIAGADRKWQLAPVTLVEQGRVAIGDDIGAISGARMVLVVIGERPGLSSPDSLGLYLTYQPRPGTRDAQRNCISNVRPRGLSYEDAGHRLMYLMGEARRRQISGVELKDRTEDIEHTEIGNANRNFLIR